MKSKLEKKEKPTYNFLILSETEQLHLMSHSQTNQIKQIQNSEVSSLPKQISR